MSSRCRRLAGTAVAVTVLGALAACSEDEPAAGDADRIVLSPPSEGADHTHAPGQEHGTAGPIGDGTAPEAGEYRMVDVRVPSEDGTGEVSFRVVDESGAPLTDYVEEQTKPLHLYVVREDLAGFRHLHPDLGDDGTWRAQADLGAPGRWRVVAELTPGGTDRPVVLGTALRVPGAWEPEAAPRGAEARTGDDGVAEVSVVESPAVGPNGEMRLVVRTPDGEPLPLGSYLGTSAHLTGFALDGGGFVHVHPIGEPEQTDEGTELTFHTTFTEPGDYRMFVQFRVEGLLHQVAVTATVG